MPDPIYSETIELDLGTVEPSLAGPRRPQDRVALHNAKSGFKAALESLQAGAKKAVGLGRGGRHGRRGAAASRSRPWSSSNMGRW